MKSSYIYCPTYSIHLLYCMLKIRKKTHKLVSMGYIPLYMCMEYMRCNDKIYEMAKNCYYDSCTSSYEKLDENIANFIKFIMHL